MKVLHRRCAGLDLHNQQIVACARLAGKGKAAYEVKTFPPTTRGLLELAGWLENLGVSHVAMEATGVYWKPVWHILEGSFQLVLANAAHIRNVPGRKSDTKDAVWIADLLAHGLIEPSFVPPRPIRELRELTRTRRQLVREIVQHRNRIRDLLETANIKLAATVSDLLGASGFRILKALVAGETNPVKLAALADRRLKCPPQELIEALRGHVTAHHRFMLARHLQIIEALEQQIAAFDAAIEKAVAPFRSIVERMKRVPGLRGGVAAPAVLAEIGADMSVFASAGHLRSWARIVPRLDESAGKKRSTRVKQGGSWLKPLLVQCAMAAGRAKGTYLQAQFQRLAARRGPKKAALAVAGSMLTALYHMIRNGTDYHDPGLDFFVVRNKLKTANHLVRRLQHLGYNVDIRAAA